MSHVELFQKAINTRAAEKNNIFCLLKNELKTETPKSKHTTNSMEK